MITGAQLYGWWLLCSFGQAMQGLAALGLVLSVLGAGIFIIGKADDEIDEKNVPKYKRLLRRIWIATAITGVFGVAIPSRNTMIALYAIPRLEHSGLPAAVMAKIKKELK
ncbi:MAG: hypothetical protein ACYCS8_18710 [Acidithiobacillus sp.]